MENEDAYFAALKLFLVFGPLLGLAALELILLLRDKRRAAQGRPLLPERYARVGSERSDKILGCARESGGHSDKIVGCARGPSERSDEIARCARGPGEGSDKQRGARGVQASIRTK